MGVANTITSACCIFSVMATASSSITHRPSVWQARQPRQNAMLLPRRETTSTVCPAARAPAAKAFASVSELLRAQAYAEDENVFGHIGPLLFERLDTAAGI